MRIVSVELGKDSYNIYIGNGLGEKIADFCRQGSFSGKGLIITDTNVGPLYGEWLSGLLRQGGIEAEVYEIAAGESSKSLAVAEALFTRCIELGLDRKSPAQCIW